MIQDLIWMVQANWDSILIILVSGLALAEAITKLTPTKTDDGFVTRVGGWIDKALAIVPNNVKRKPADEAFKK